MKKILLPVTVRCFLLSGHSNADSISAQVGKDFTELAAGIGSKWAGLGINGNWARSDHDGQVVSLEATFGLPLGLFTAYIGGKAYYLSPQDNNNGFAFAAGVGANWQIIPSLGFYMGKFMAHRVISLRAIMLIRKRMWVSNMK
ncbi:YfaZ family outer membrane protein [Arsenophonus endosymbiont of Aleurodicus floccissimus]|uniref:YfaZ family outer membrane protein n=1 Tax=Arsenophonus endosymbiont of Aleurodicus floccissimus TaxID=2152761 RepID=UPI0034E25B58